MNRAPRFTALAKAVLGWAAFFLLVFLLSQGASASDCPVPRVPAIGDRCTAAFTVLQEPGRVDRVPVYVVRYKSLEAADLSSWAVPGAVVVPLDGLQRGLQVAVPLSILSECRP